MRGWGRSCLRLVIVAVAGFSMPALAQVAPPTGIASSASENARDVLARARTSVVQIKGFFGTNSAPAFHGTGFAVRAGGTFITNYHVVAERVHYPDKYRLEYRTPEGATGKVDVLAVDVRHDLALVRTVGHAPPPLKLSMAEPAKGERAYSIGFPLDVGLTITEGVSNGKVEDSFDPRIHYSGAINGGMSGGPALNAAGDVIGVNVSGYRFQQLVSFLVPIEHVRALEAAPSPREAGADVSSLKDAVAVQLRAHSKALSDGLDGPIKTQATAGYLLPGKLAPFIDCTATGNPVPNDPVQTERIACAAKAGLYVQQSLSSGEIKYLHVALSTEKLDSWRFSGRLANLTSASGAFGSKRHVGPYACENRVVRLKGFDAGLLVCTRSYRKLEGLYDFTVRVSSLNSGKRGFASHLDMYGLEFTAGMDFIQRYIAAMEWKPSEDKPTEGKSTEGKP
jgi:serine protease Do